MREREDKKGAEAERDGATGEHNELGYRNVNEEAQYDERGSQGPGPGEPPPNETDD